MLEINLVLTGQFKQQVQRPLKATDIDDQHALVDDGHGLRAQWRLAIGPALWGAHRFLVALVLTAHAGIILASSPPLIPRDGG